MTFKKPALALSAIALAASSVVMTPLASAAAGDWVCHMEYDPNIRALGEVCQFVSSSPAPAPAPVDPAPAAAPAPEAVSANAGDAAPFHPGAPELSAPLATQVVSAGQPVQVDLGSFISYHSPSTTWMVGVDWGDGTTTQKQVATTGGLGAWTHTYADAGNYVVNVSVEDGRTQTGSHEIPVKVVA
jgi:hypothetical protein